MGKNKLKKFEDMARMDIVFQYPWAELQKEGFALRGRWHSEFFHNDNPIVLELGCGKGEYTVGLARTNPDRNYIGIDIKGARMWTGARQAVDEQLPNVAFLRTDIELLPYFFAPGEVDEIWITFPDPQMKKVRKRLTSTRFMELYRKVLGDGGMINLKTDSPFLYTYTGIMARSNRFPIEIDTADLYHSGMDSDTLRIRTYYEQQWLDRGLTIKYVRFALPQQGELVEPEVEIEHDTYRSFSRGELQCPEKCIAKVEHPTQK
ncbi:MAG: tRNA (guanosine(46)-N7)-methyltransferase TrmB [Bacteroides sp.]|nr:tRNA (guanosine(46)-N7)-methyltransferase TrmB [Bacteroides sp.]MCM1413811.1 tRNA (guanosine(46)-N7)-methyltransferase TrmB [Bacteroides sp.]MCM1471245.1 tRNA (guanosine(46)-N7)-methyltransferase TrmB [Bacteroides sp.]